MHLPGIGSEQQGATSGVGVRQDNAMTTLLFTRAANIIGPPRRHGQHIIEREETPA